MKLLRDIFVYADVQIVVYIFAENARHAMSAKGDAKFYTDENAKWCSEDFLWENCEFKTDYTKESESCEPTSEEQFPVFCEKDHSNRFMEHYLQYQPKDLTN